MITETIPELPSRETELKYLDFFEKDVLEDNWLATRFHARMAGPQRIPFKRLT